MSLLIPLLNVPDLDINIASEIFHEESCSDPETDSWHKLHKSEFINPALKTFGGITVMQIRKRTGYQNTAKYCCQIPGRMALIPKLVLVLLSVWDDRLKQII